MTDFKELRLDKDIRKSYLEEEWEEHQTFQATTLFAI